MKLQEIKIGSSVLKKEIGWSWLWLFIKALIKKRAVFNNSPWAKQNNEEAKLAKRLAITVALYQELIKKIGKQKAFEIMGKIIIPIGYNEQVEILNSLNLQQKEAINKLLAFYNFVGQQAFARFVERKIVAKNDRIFHFQIQNCFFKKFYDQAKAGELTRLMCAIDKVFYSKHFPEFKFHRGNSWENTIAYDKEYCEFIFEKI